MKPNCLQYFFARNWLINAWFGACVLITTSTAVYMSGLTLDSLREFSAVFWLVIVLALGCCLGWFIAFPAGWFFLGPVYYIVGSLNGAPYGPGDKVRILHGPLRDRIATVNTAYNDERRMLSLELDDDEVKKSGTSLFHWNEVCRVKE